MKLGEIAAALGCELRGEPGVEVTAAAAIEDAPPGTITFLADRRLARHLATTRASAVVLPADAPDAPVASLRVADPYVAFVRVIELLHPPSRPAPARHPTAVVADDAVVGPGAFLGAYAVVGERVRIGRDAVLHAGVRIYPDVTIGDGFTAHAGAVVREGVRIGDRVTLHAGAVIGSDGFGYLPGPDGPRKIPHVGTVVLEDDVEIGANATIDRAMLGATTVGRGTKIDNLVMVSHGCRLGAGCLLAGQVGLSGGTMLGAGVMMGGQAGSAGHNHIGDGARIAAQSGVHGDLAPGGTYGGGVPAVDIRRWRRIAAAYVRLPELVRRLRRLERTLGVAGDAEA